MVREITDSLAIQMIDLRELFNQNRGPCPYQASNMHWTREGHEMVAEFLAKVLEKRMPTVIP
jgi:lysophospholipase L1-like esterase